MLTTILVGGAALRFWSLTFGLPLTQARPDESRILNLAMRIANGDPNPHYFVYPSLYLYIVAAALKVQMLAFGVKDALELSTARVFLTGRTITAAFGTATVWVVFALGRRMRDPLVGLAASALVAVAFLHVRDSHFSTTDVPMTCGVLVALLMMLRDRLTIREVAAAGVATGLAASLKYNAVLVAPVLLVLETHAAASGEQSWTRALVRMITFAAAVAAGFLAGSPFAAIEPRTFLAHVTFVERYVAGGHVHDGRTLAVANAGWRYFTAILPAAVGWPVLLAGVAGLALLVWRTPRTGVAIALFPVVYFLTAARAETVFARYMIPEIPFVCLGAGYLVRALTSALKPPARGIIAGAALTAAIAFPTALNAVRVDALLGRRDSRLLAGDWLDANVGVGRTLWISGARYGQPLLRADRRIAEGFQETPDYVIVQRSPLELYSAVPDALLPLLQSRYRLVQTFRTGIASLTPTDFDESDAFFIPLTHLETIRRPGPDFDVYERAR